MWKPRPFVRTLRGWQTSSRARSSSWAAATLALGLLASGLGMYASDSWGIRPSVAMPAADGPLRTSAPRAGSASPDAQPPGPKGPAAGSMKLATRPIEQLRVGVCDREGFGRQVWRCVGVDELLDMACPSDSDRVGACAAVAGAGLPIDDAEPLLGRVGTNDQNASGRQRAV